MKKFVNLAIFYLINNTSALQVKDTENVGIKITESKKHESSALNTADDQADDAETLAEGEIEDQEEETAVAADDEDTDKSLAQFAQIDNEADEKLLAQTDLDAGPIGEGFAQVSTKDQDAEIEDPNEEQIVETEMKN